MAFSALVDRIYGAVEHPDAWTDFVGFLTETADARVGLMLGRNLADGDHEVVARVGLGAEEAGALAALEAVALATHARRSMDGQGAAVTADLSAERDTLDDRLHGLRPSHVLMSAMRRGASNEAHLLLVRVEGDEPFPEEAVRLLDDLVPHLRRAARLARTVDGHLLARRAVEGVLDRLNTGVVVVDQGCNPLYRNTAARRILVRGDGLRPAQHTLAAAYPGDTQALRAAVHGVTSEGGVRGLPVARPSMRRPYGVLVVPIDRDEPHPEPAEADGHVPAAALFIADPETQGTVSRDLLGMLYGLTPAEATLVTGLAEGKRLEEMADERGVSKNTLRTQLHHVFAKTGTNRQVDLIRLVLSGTALMHPAEP